MFTYDFEQNVLNTTAGALRHDLVTKQLKGMLESFERDFNLEYFRTVVNTVKEEEGNICWRIQQHSTPKQWREA